MQLELEFTPVLRPYQETGIERVKSMDRMILGDDTGLGKTAVALHGRHYDAGLVVCPAALKMNWCDETTKWTGLKPVPLFGKNSFRWPEKGEVVIVNPDIMPDWHFECPHPISVYHDEIQWARNGFSSAKFRNTYAVMQKLHHSSQVVGMTATPIANRLGDLCNILDMLGLLDRYYGGREGFATMCGGRVGSRGVISKNCEPTPQMLEILKKIMLRRKKDDVVDQLPSQQFSVMRVGGYSRKLRTTMDRAWDSLQAYEEMNGPLRGRLPALADLSRARREMAEFKSKPTKRMVEGLMDEQKKVVVFSAHRAPVEDIGSLPNWGRINGSVTTKNRQKIAQALQDGELNGIAATIGAANSGLTLDRADTMILTDLAYNYAENEQALGRIRRVSTKHRSVSYTYIVCDHDLDRRLGQICTTKATLFNAICEPCETKE